MKVSLLIENLRRLPQDADVAYIENTGRGMVYRAINEVRIPRDKGQTMLYDAYLVGNIDYSLRLKTKEI